MDRNDSGGGLLAGGVIALLVVLMACVPVIKALFIELGKTFEAFSGMMQSIVNFALYFAIDALLLGAAVMAIYLTYRFVRMIREGTDLKRRLDISIETHQANVEAKLSDIQDSIYARIRYMERTLDEALKEPEATPAKPVAPLPIVLPVKHEPGTPEYEDSDITDQEDSDLRAVQNPY